MKLTALMLAFYMLVGGLLPRSDFSQLLHAQDLLNHYDLHVIEAVQEGKTFTVQDFLWVHFIQPDGHEHSSDHDAHHNLPGYSCNTSFLMLALELPIIQDYFKIKIADLPNFFHNSLFLKGFLSTLFHPPCLK